MGKRFTSCTWAFGWGIFFCQEWCLFIIWKKNNAIYWTYESCQTRRGRFTILWQCSILSSERQGIEEREKSEFAVLMLRQCKVSYWAFVFLALIQNISTSRIWIVVTVLLYIFWPRYLFRCKAWYIITTRDQRKERW